MKTLTKNYHFVRGSNRSSNTLIATAFLMATAATHAATLTLTPTYSRFGTDYTWSDNTGKFTVPSVASDYPNEIWERPVESGKWSDSGGTRTLQSDGKYFAYNDIQSAAMGWDNDYLYARITVVDGATWDSSSWDHGVGYKGHYYVYFSHSPQGANGYIMELDSGTSLSGTYADNSPTDQFNPSSAEYTNDPAYLFHDANGDVGGGGLNYTYDNKEPGEAQEYDRSDGFKAEITNAVYARRDGNTVHFALKFSLVSGLDSAYMDALSDTSLVRFGVATSNPSAPNGDILANDEFTEAQSGDTTYDTVGLDPQGPVIPEPSTPMLAALGALSLLIRKVRK